MISLFAGIGGFDLAGRWAGWDTVVTSEINPFGRRVLEHYWPGAYHHGDIKTLTKDVITKNSKWDEKRPTIITGGFPCPSFSLAGKRRGREDERYLWPEMCRIIREIRPLYIVAENVLGIVSIEGGMVFDQVQADMEAEGYEVQPYVLPACGVNAPHKRERVWFVGRRGDGVVAGPGLFGQTERQIEPMGVEQLREKQLATNAESEQGQRFGFEQRETGATEQGQFRGGGGEMGDGGNAPNTNVERFTGKEHRKEKPGFFTEEGGTKFWRNFPSVSPLCQRNYGLSDHMVRTTFPGTKNPLTKWRNESITAMGNAIVPQVAYQIFGAINDYEKLITKL